jgi:hypothetical protein
MAGSYQPNGNGTSGGRGKRPAALRRLALLAGLALALAPATGCVTLDVLYPLEKPPVGLPCQLATTWEPGLRQALDPYHGGAPYHALAGRLFLFDAEGTHLITGDGEIKVELFDDRPLAVGGTPVALERWDFPSEVAKLLCRKDAVGWGYTLVLPWITSYRPEITQVHVRVCYQPPGGAPMYIESSAIKLAQENLVLPQGVAQPSGLKPTAPPPLTPPATLRLERKPTPAANPEVPGPQAVPVQAPTPVATQTAAEPVEAVSDELRPIILTPRKVQPQTATPVPTQAVDQAADRAPANFTLDAAAQGPAQPVRQTAARIPAKTAGPAAQPGWIGVAK